MNAIIKEIEATLPTTVKFSANLPEEHKAGTALTLPTATNGSETAQIYFKEAMTTEAVKVTTATITPTKNGKAEITYAFTNFVVVKILNVVDPSLRMSFEGSDPWHGGANYATKQYGVDSKYEKIVEDQYGGHALQITPILDGGFGIYNPANIDFGTAKKMKIVYTVNQQTTFVAGIYSNGWKWQEKTVTLNAGSGEVIVEYDAEIQKLQALNLTFKGQYKCVLLIHEIYVVA